MEADRNIWILAERMEPPKQLCLVEGSGHSTFFDYDPIDEELTQVKVGLYEWFAEAVQSDHVTCY